MDNWLYKILLQPVGVFSICQSYRGNIVTIKKKYMETQNEKKGMAPLWFWSQPENGMSVEDSEAIVKASVTDINKKINPPVDRYLHIVFM